MEFSLSSAELIEITNKIFRYKDLIFDLIFCVQQPIISYIRPQVPQVLKGFTKIWCTIDFIRFTDIQFFFSEIPSV